MHQLLNSHNPVSSSSISLSNDFEFIKMHDFAINYFFLVNWTSTTWYHLQSYLCFLSAIKWWRGPNGCYASLLFKLCYVINDCAYYYVVEFIEFVSPIQCCRFTQPGLLGTCFCFWCASLLPPPLSLDWICLNWFLSDCFLSTLVVFKSANLHQWIDLINKNSSIPQNESLGNSLHVWRWISGFVMMMMDPQLVL